MGNLDISEESNNEIHIDVEEDNKEVEPAEGEIKMDFSPILKDGSQEVRINVVENLISSMNKGLAALANDSYTVCIYRVSEKYRKSKEEAYTPRVVSIGPLHYGKSHLQKMEAYKLKYLQSFIFKFGIGIDKLIVYASNKEAQVRGCYEDTSKFESEEFCRMILLDGIFVVQLFVNNHFIHMREPGDMLFQNKWMASDLMHDMLLLENQLPLNYILGLFNFLDGSRVHQKSFYYLSLKYFNGVVGNTNQLKPTLDCEHSKHLVEFLLILHLPSSNRQKVPSGKCENTRSASHLHAAGVHFGHGTGESFKVSFVKNGGLLILPQLTVNDKTETFFRNLIAYEQCGHYAKYITSYVIFMDGLINTAEDVEMLVNCGIIKNLLGENQQVADLFNNLYKEVIEEQKDFYFAEICNDLNAYSKDYIHEWMSEWFKLKTLWLEWKLMLINKYFNNPWSAIGFIAATIVVVLTVVQTVCSILALYQ